MTALQAGFVGPQPATQTCLLPVITVASAGGLDIRQQVRFILSNKCELANPTDDYILPEHASSATHQYAPRDTSAHSFVHILGLVIRPLRRLTRRPLL